MCYKVWFLVACVQYISCSLTGITSNTTIALSSSIKECRIYNWKRMACYWDRYFVNGEEVPMILKFNSRICRPSTSKNRNSSQIDDGYKNCKYQNVSEDGLQGICHFVEPFYMVPHDIILLSSNTSLVSDSSFCMKNYNDIVHPDPVSSLKLKLLTSSSAELEWRAPAERKNFTYSISYFSQWNDLVLEINTTERHLVLKDLRPYTAYFLDIKCIHLYDSRKIRGFWSDKTTTRFTTLEDVPAEAPTLLPGSFMFMDEDKVKIFWQPVQAQLHNGVFVYARIRAINITYVVEPHKHKLNQSNGVRLLDVIPEEQIVNTSANEVLLHLNSHKNHLVYIDQGTSVGFNNSIELTPIMVNSRKIAPPGIKITKATVDGDGLFQFSWNALENALSHTFYWCKAEDPMSCMAPFEFEVIPGNSTCFQKHLTDNHKMIFASSSKYNISGNIVQSGMKFVSCIYNSSKIFDDPPQNFHPVNAGSSGVIQLVWDLPNCFPNYPPYFSHYEVSYCPLNECKASRKKKISHNVNKVTVSGLVSGKMMLFSIKTCLNNVTSQKSAESQILIPSPQKSMPGLSQLPLPMALTVVACAAALVLFGISLSLLAKLREPLKIDVPEFKETSVPYAFHLK